MDFASSKAVNMAVFKAHSGCQCHVWFYQRAALLLKVTDKSEEDVLLVLFIL